jgi:hypothetical protein
MKAKKTKDLNKKVKKQIKNDLEINLKSKLTDFVKSLGHDANDIGTELKKMSRLIAKKLSRKVKSVKSITEFKDDKKAAASKPKVVKKEAVKSPEKVKKVIAKVVKKSGDKAATIEDIVKKEIINPAKVVLESKDEASEVKPVVAAKSAPVAKSRTKSAAAKPVIAKAEGTTKPVVKKRPAAPAKDSQNKSNIRKPGAVKKSDDKG